MDASTVHRYMQDSTTFFFFFIDVLIITFNCLLFIGYIQNALTVNFHSIFTIARSSNAPGTNDQRGSQSVNNPTNTFNNNMHLTTKVPFQFIHREDLCVVVRLDVLRKRIKRNEHSKVRILRTTIFDPANNSDTRWNCLATGTRV